MCDVTGVVRHVCLIRSPDLGVCSVFSTPHPLSQSLYLHIVLYTMYTQSNILHKAYVLLYRYFQYVTITHDSVTLYKNKYADQAVFAALSLADYRDGRRNKKSQAAFWTYFQGHKWNSVKVEFLCFTSLLRWLLLKGLLSQCSWCYKRNKQKNKQASANTYRQYQTVLKRWNIFNYWIAMYCNMNWQNM